MLNVADVLASASRSVDGGNKQWKSLVKGQSMIVEPGEREVVHVQEENLLAAKMPVLSSSNATLYRGLLCGMWNCHG
jgi:hypothetical protein